MKIQIEVELPDEMADPADSSGLNAEAWQEVFDALVNLGGVDIDIRPAGP